MDIKRYGFATKDASLEEIKNKYHLREIFINGSAQIENVAATIQSLLFYEGAIKSHQCSESLQASLCRTMIIMSYSVVEAVVISVGFLIQARCRNCQRNCLNKSKTMFEGKSAKENERNAFWKADQFLTNKGIIKFDGGAKAFYNAFRNGRNNVHLLRNTKILFKDPRFTEKNCQISINFLNQFIDIIYSNYKEYILINKCLNK